jgi:hypothetical protein
MAYGTVASRGYSGRGMALLRTIAKTFLVSLGLSVAAGGLVHILDVVPPEKAWGRDPVFLIGFMTVFGFVGGLAGHLVEWSNNTQRAKEVARADITSAWQREGSRRLEVNLAVPSVNGTRLGGDIHGLSFLGPAEDNASAPEGQLGYPSRGLFVEMSEGRLTRVELDFVPASEGNTTVVLFRGQEGSKPLKWGSTEGDIGAALGTPFWRQTHEDGSLTLYFERFNGERWEEIQLMCDEAGRLNACDLASAPELAEQRRRERMGVTVDWPPACRDHVLS